MCRVAREAIRTTVRTIKKKPRKPIHKHSTVHIKRIDLVIPKQDDAMATSSEPQSSYSTIQADANQSANYDKSGNSPSIQIDDHVYEQLKQLPEKLLVQLPCGVIRDAAEHLKNANDNALAGFIVFRTDLHPQVFHVVTQSCVGNSCKLLLINVRNAVQNISFERMIPSNQRAVFGIRLSGRSRTLPI
ncbi:unnamed protein product [Onchocerca flexuosa]|uniref:Spt5-NGN domain-containing protein n=1 Tax=Onchocerca flexuosa TaxID=387005 RepID=A0A183GZB7_9BILA|nr:unnamed protein product [Onchocerca flexuosa]